MHRSAATATAGALHGPGAPLRTTHPDRRSQRRTLCGRPRGEPTGVRPASSRNVEASVDESTSLAVPETEMPSLRERFAMADIDGNGLIDEEELRALLESAEGGRSYLLDHWLPESALRDAIALYDTDGSGDIDFDEFVAIVADDRLLKGRVTDYEEAFRAMDASGRGAIGMPELSRLLASLGQGMSEERIAATFRKYDVDASGTIEFDEFLLMFHDKLLDLRQVLDYIRLAPEASSPGAGFGAPSAEVAAGEVREIESEEELDAVLASAPGLVVLFAGLAWCRPCKAAVKPYKKLAERYRAATFLKVLGNLNASTKSLMRDRLGVAATPAFYFFRNGEVVDSHTGASRQKMETGVIKNLKPEEHPAEGPVLFQF
ncbi:unnamed protein product [Ostreobium quekettii]|uniref:Calmodulin n=1 Tax=Ostreobium quekettii TaxID=121088 RepID=A0A8S1J7C3_9CHLO|nr:unnamed protein product [Ostreobium quekettii]|eukprot:evm.model.scf_3240.1 EVM.evm.TU.scf_3240.1   scf_3240:3024-5446(-)